MNWKKRAYRIQQGDKVCYRSEFLKSTGVHTGSMPMARGCVQEIIQLGETQLAVIDWNDDTLPQKVNVSNLAKVSERGIDL